MISCRQWPAAVEPAEWHLAPPVHHCKLSDIWETSESGVSGGWPMGSGSVCSLAFCNCLEAFRLLHTWAIPLLWSRQQKAGPALQTLPRTARLCWASARSAHLPALSASVRSALCHRAAFGGRGAAPGNVSGLLCHPVSLETPSGWQQEGLFLLRLIPAVSATSNFHKSILTE